MAPISPLPQPSNENNPFDNPSTRFLSLFTSPRMDGDLEKDAFVSPPSSSSSSSTPTTSLPHLGLRRRRLLGQTFAILAILALGGWALFGPRDLDLRELLDSRQRWRSHSSASSIGVSADDYPETGMDDPLIPGIMIGSNGETLTVAASEAETKTLSHAEHMAELAHIQPQQWGLDLSGSRLLQGMRLWPANPARADDSEPLSVLGHFADDIYKYGPLDSTEYSAQLYEFIRQAFPKKTAAQLSAGLEYYLPSSKVEAGAEAGVPWDKNKYVWQTDKDSKREGTTDVVTWKKGGASGEGWKWDLMTDSEADKYVRKKLGGSKMFDVWNNLPSGILRSDTLRYLLLLLEGGIYSDTDTTLLKPPSVWGRGARLWKDGEGWLDPQDKARIDAGEDMESVLGKPSVVVGLEADVGNREDWYDWWPRPIQIVQWTMASTPFHPIPLQATLRILHSTATAIDWAHENARVVKILKDQGRYEDAKNLAAVPVLAEPNDGGPVGVMAWTGPGVWTDAVLSYLRVKYGMVWTDLKGIQEPLRVGDVVILPVTGFSPGVGNFGSQGTWHREAMVQHKFRGSWKPNPN